MISKKKWHVKDKWKRHLALARHRRLLKHIPPTQLLTKNNLKKFIQHHKTVFIKPINGAHGNNILKITHHKKSFVLKHENKNRRISKSEIVNRLYRKYHGRRYMIQKGISLRKIQGRLIDFRMLLLRPYKDWTIMGIMGKMAKRKNFVTNFSHGGKPIKLRQSLRKTGLSEQEIRQIINQMNRLGILVARKFNQRYKHCRRLGIDIAMDTQNKIWILEVNTNPGYELFKNHNNKKLYNKIESYMKIIKKQQLDH